MTGLTDHRARCQSLPAALAALDAAVTALCGPLNEVHTNRVRFIPSRYLQLQGATEGEQSNVGGGGGSKSRPPLWLDAFDLLAEIDTALQCWQPAYTGVPPTVGRLHCLQNRKWRPQDCHQIQQISQACTEWATQIDGLLNPEPHAYLMAPDPSTEPAPCTNCGTRHVFRRDSSGERVRQPALKITKDGCRCQHCHTTWQPGQMKILAKALGYPLTAEL